MHSQRELISTTAAANYAEHYVWLPHFREEDREQGRQKNERLVKRKRERPSGYAAEGFLCGPGDKPSQAKKKARAEEWVRPDASRERMQNEIAAAKPRAITTKAQAGQEAAVAAAKQRLVASAPAAKRRRAEMDVERAVNGTLAAKAMRQSSEPEDSWDPPSGKVLVDRAELVE